MAKNITILDGLNLQEQQKNYIIKQSDIIRCALEKIAYEMKATELNAYLSIKDTNTQNGKFLTITTNRNCPEFRQQMLIEVEIINKK